MHKSIFCNFFKLKKKQLSIKPKYQETAYNSEINQYF
jgi:hypothetical protein